MLEMPYYSARGARNAVARFRICCTIVFALSFSSFAQQKRDQLLVHGDNFLFSVKEPAGWKGDTPSAEQFQSNVVLHEATQPAESNAGLIRVRLNDKADENVSAGMEGDIRSYRAQYSKIQFKDIDTRNPAYPAVHFSVSMNSPKSEATAKQLDAYESTLASLKLLKS